MTEQIKVLLLEDEAADADLIRRALTSHLPGSVLHTVQNREDYLAGLSSGEFNIVLSDGSVPGCEGLTAFYLARERQPQLPFIYLSQFVERDGDVHGLKALGVAEFLSKSDLAKLGEAVQAALQGSASSEHHGLLSGYERLVSVVKDLSIARSLPAIMQTVRRAAREITGADGATFVLREGDLCHYADEDAIGPLWKGQKFPMEICVSGWAMKHRQPAVVEDVFSDPRVPLSAYEPTFVRSLVMAPIRAMDPIGAIGVYWARKRMPTAVEVRLLQALADTTAVAMENVRIYDELEVRVRERTAELEAFTYAVSHDLRAPVRHAHAYASILIEDHGDKLDAEARADADKIVQSTARMGEMFEGLLGLSRMAQVQIVTEAVDLAVMAHELAQECEILSKRSAEFIAPDTLQVMGDPRLLRSALQNLIANAWKFTGNQAAPRIEFGVTSQPDAPVVYYVRDNGAGFDQEYAKNLFMAFRRLHAQDEFPGHGIGLATVHRIVLKHGGRIWAAGKVNEGATFYFTLGDNLNAVAAASLNLQ